MFWARKYLHVFPVFQHYDYENQVAQMPRDIGSSKGIVVFLFTHVITIRSFHFQSSGTRNVHMLLPYIQPTFFNIFFLLSLFPHTNVLHYRTSVWLVRFICFLDESNVKIVVLVIKDRIFVLFYIYLFTYNVKLTDKICICKMFLPHLIISRYLKVEA